jgi:IclR family pca regulon transcriptional regulator
MAARAGSARRIKKQKVTAPDDEQNSGLLVNGFARGLKVIRAFGEGAERLTLTEVAFRASLTRAGARRLLLTLERLGYANHEGRKYFLTPKVLSLGYAYVSSMPLWNVAQPILARLVHETDQTCSISVLDDLDVVYILRIPVRRILSIGGNVGSRLPAFATSMGRVLLAGLTPKQLEDVLARVEFIPFTDRTIADMTKLKKTIAQARNDGYSWVEGEIEDHICGLSVPILDSDKNSIAALNISFNQPRISRDATVKKYLPALRTAAEQMTRSISIRHEKLPA